MPGVISRSSRSFTTTFFSASPREEHHDTEPHSEHHQVAPSGDSPFRPNNIRLDNAHGHEIVAQQFTDFPPPIPDSGLRTALSVLSYSRTTLSPFISRSSSSSSVIFSSPLAPATLTVSNALSQPSFSASPTAHPSISSSPVSPQPKSSNPTKIPVVAIASVAAGVGLFIVAGFIFLRVCTRSRRRDRPKPSLPILDDPFPEEDICKDNESPLFGGKERFSSHNGGSGGLSAWSQYPRVRSTELPTVQLFPPSPASAVPDPHPPLLPPSAAAPPRGLPAPRPPPSQSVPTLGPSLLTTSSSRQATVANSTESLHRLSAKSLSLYPATPSINEPEGDTSFSACWVSRTNDTKADDGPEIAYDGADIASPRFMAQDLPEDCPTSPLPSGGRSRIKSSYFSYTPGSYPRMSSVQSGLVATSKTHDGFDLKKLPPIHKSESTRDKSKALATALGMTSHSMTYSTSLSPQPSTLYPDDSLSVVEARRLSKRLHRKPTPNRKQLRKSALPMDTGTPVLMRVPTLDSSTALGSLMLMDFGAKSSGTLSATEPGAHFTSSKGSKALPSGPPRVPSPPALPSLAQMGLEHANPEVYAEYRSATYSICGLYEGDRKSRLV
ncbi:hypothetical protein V5O48_000487 [Marasmius crinis-equi]|uniref:Uncharacterized protein n=1 Tax=Marasmius crinis-equi TaxID=585013 RepID=A0ABR3G188_9AGAR